MVLSLTPSELSAQGAGRRTYATGEPVHAGELGTCATAAEGLSPPATGRLSTVAGWTLRREGDHQGHVRERYHPGECEENQGEQDHGTPLEAPAVKMPIEVL